jgi:predicted phosphate transport protein (TIGR00153 family)
VRLRLTPRETGFYELLSQSAANLVTGTSLLVELLGAEHGDRVGIVDRMREAEHAGDDATHAIMRALNTTFVTPFDREDIYRLASNLDDVMDFMEAAADLVVLYQIVELPTQVAQQVEVLQRAAELTAEAMPRLRSMENLAEYWIEINRLENIGDQVYRQALAHLFNDGRYDAITVLKLKEVVDQLEAAADAFEHVANTIETIAVKES